MAQIIENLHGRRSIRVSTDDIISLVREYQSVACSAKNYEDLRTKLDKKELFIPEDVL